MRLRLLLTKAGRRLSGCVEQTIGAVSLKQLIMQIKLTVIFLFLLLFDAGAKGVAQRVTIEVRNPSLKTVIEKIEKQTGFVFFYNEKEVDLTQKITLNAKSFELNELLERSFGEQDLSFIILNNTIAIRKKGTEVVADFFRKPPVTMAGVVIDAVTGAPLERVTILVTDAEQGVLTNARGEFSLIAPEGKEVVFSYVGYEPVKIKSRHELGMVIRMKPAVKAMDETVVITGIYNRKAESFTGSTLKVTNEELRKVGNANVFQALKNISPSMFLDNFTMGSNPNTLPDMQLRGTSTFGSDASEAAASLKGNYVKNPNEPLFILDGFEATAERIFDLDINRIESVTILKDAASKAIYGSRAANGVIVVETKKTTTGQTLVHYNGSIDVELPDLTSYNLANSFEKLEAERLDGMYIDRRSNTAHENIALQQLYESRRKLALEGLNTDWIAKPLRNGVGQRHTLGVELGARDLRLIADVSYRDVQGVMRGSSRKNVTANMNGSYRLNNFLFRNIMSVNSNTANESPYGTFSDYAQMNPYWRAVNADGTIPYLAELGPNGERYTNPLFNSTINTKIQSTYFNFTNNFYLEWTMMPGLKAIARAGVDVKRSDADEFYPAAHTRFDNYLNLNSERSRKGSYQVNNGKSNFLSGDFNVNYSKVSGKNSLFTNVGFNINERRYNEIIHLVEGFSSDRLENIIFGRAYAYESRPTGVDAISREAGFLGAFSYMYDGRYMVDLTYRRSANSNFGADRKWGNFWSIGAGWNLHEERLFQNYSWLQQFKLRGSIGATGNPNFTNNASIPTYLYYLESQYQGFPGSYLNSLANSTLQWESKLDYNLGADIRIKGLTLRAELYQSYTENLVTAMSVPTSTGFATMSENIGKVKNSGFEIYGNYVVYQKGANFISINASIETNKNKIVSLSNAMKAYNDRMDKKAADLGTGTPVKKYYDGASMNTIWAVPSLGIDPSTGREIYIARDGSTTYNWNAANMVAAGNSLPAYQGVFGISGEYRRFGLTVTARYLGGGDLYNQTLVDRVENVNMLYNVDRRVLNGRWQYPGQQVLFKKLGTYVYVNEDGYSETRQEMTRATSRFVQKRDELDIAAVNAYYYISPAIARKLGMQRLKVAFNMNDLVKFSSIRIERGTEYPFSRTLSFSVSATF